MLLTTEQVLKESRVLVSWMTIVFSLTVLSGVVECYLMDFHDPTLIGNMCDSTYVCVHIEPGYFYLVFP